MLVSMSRADKYLPTGNNYVSRARFDFCEQLPNDNFEVCFHRFVAQLYFSVAGKKGKKTSLKQNGRTSIHVGCGDRGSWVHIPLNPINFVFLLQYIDDIFYIYNKAREIDKGVR